MEIKKALVVLSGGQDSVTTLGVALAEYDAVETIMFDYGQRHSVELIQAQEICRLHGVPFTSMKIPMLQELGDSALIEGSEHTDVNKPHHANKDLPASFVPNRNALFLTTAHAMAQKIGAQDILTGVCQTDYSGYPDCREVFIKSLEKTLNVGYETDISIKTPLMNLTKAQTFALAESCGFLDTVVALSHTCYLGDRTKMHEWGAGCGECAACKLRKKGFEEFKEGIA
jgi:7-cyano-7-deazaguanine synthase